MNDVLRPIPGFPGYSATRDGRVFGKRGWIKMRPHYRTGVFQCNVRITPGSRAYSNLSAHRAVLLAWVGLPPAGMEGCHNDGDPSNNSLSNLRWDTRSANQLDRLKHGGNPLVKLTPGAVRRIRVALAGGEPQTSIANRHGVSQATVSLINSGVTWSHVD